MLKTKIRALFKEKRKGLSFLEINRISNEISNAILEKFDFSNKHVSIFLSIEKQKEFNTNYLLNELINKAAIPVLSKSNFENSTLQLFKYDASTKLVENEFGIPEPENGDEVNEKELDFVFVPLLAFDMLGNRVGYGKGFYDKLLNKCSNNCVFIGVSLFEEYVEIDDLNPYDIPLDYCFTPTNFYEFR